MIKVGGQIVRAWYRRLAAQGVEQAHVNARAIHEALATVSSIGGKRVTLTSIIGEAWAAQGRPRVEDLSAAHFVILYTFLREQGVCFDYTALLTQVPFRQQPGVSRDVHLARQRSLIRVVQSMQRFDLVRSPGRRAR